MEIPWYVGFRRNVVRYFTADLHIGHENILAYAARPFADLDAMSDHIVSRWNQTVTVDDEVWVLGDLVMGERDVTLGVVGRLAGRIVLVPGNHDRCWTGWPFRNRNTAADQLARWRNRYLQAGVDQIIDEPEPLLIAGTSVSVSHFPFIGGGDHTPVERYTEFRLSDSGSWLLCGHVHDLFRQRGRQINVGLDAWGGELVPEDVLARLITSGPADLPVIPWQTH